MHIAAARSSATDHLNFTVAILMVTLVTSLVTNVVQNLIPHIWVTLTSNVALALIAGLTAINNFLGYQKREVEHREAKNGHARAAGLIAISLACADDTDPETFDYSKVLTELQEIHDNLKKMTVNIPTWIANRYPEYEAPWRFRKDISAETEDPFMNNRGSRP